MNAVQQILSQGAPLLACHVAIQKVSSFIMAPVAASNLEPDVRSLVHCALFSYSMMAGSVVSLATMIGGGVARVSAWASLTGLHAAAVTMAVTQLERDRSGKIFTVYGVLLAVNNGAAAASVTDNQWSNIVSTAVAATSIAVATSIIYGGRGCLPSACIMTSFAVSSFALFLFKNR